MQIIAAQAEPWLINDYKTMLCPGPSKANGAVPILPLARLGLVVLSRNKSCFISIPKPVFICVALYWSYVTVLPFYWTVSCGLVHQWRGKSERKAIQRRASSSFEIRSTKRKLKKRERSGPEHDLLGYACKFIHQWPMHTNNPSRKPKTLIVINMSIFTVIASVYARSNHSFMYCQAIKFLP